ncbi:hypothetical protein [Hydrogenophaga sp. BPS33]|uniref:hypothetical protein n=1 Tax=Hydrogenophaga sp. BPS33 TaxID=2651974 RepID=UPI0013201585|nr:hypothetical protein [Hydrogenophaga sp. BPS33]QHE85701.1 hypothetical protein F9K07_12715 [Hydrogenophaga sp. BPS33]
MVRIRAGRGRPQRAEKWDFMIAAAHGATVVEGAALFVVFVFVFVFFFVVGFLLSWLAGSRPGGRLTFLCFVKEK